AGSVDAVAEEVRRLRAASHTDATVGVEAQAEHLLGRVAYDVRDRDLVRDRSVVGAPEHDPGTDAHAALTERDVAAITGRRDVGRVGETDVLGDPGTRMDRDIGAEGPQHVDRGFKRI